MARIPLLVYERGIFREAHLEDLREAVYMLVSTIPVGKVATYKCIANILGVSPRLVALVLKENKQPIVVPCHRVVMSSLRVGGYSMGGSRVKERLLSIEGVTVRAGGVSESSVLDECRVGSTKGRRKS
ncbi:methylated-DNA--protein-cysteinemethyltransferase [Thermogladius calderae 1633]|uniref:Methylated-DNA--protein-cysteinemethyltransferase n=1 Tax=Thermogladius calderae (strain DSM 22663 / VKM B-2946 / 1633) TaxID=1184251 RepID=I3TG19_THEC1|nr:MGMT family protein [Thermogladius calderae]AFK51707.1 methylated-DNA--protein-cysteinemethyltransferase [Thermogladius calderae 1633]